MKKLFILLMSIILIVQINALSYSQKNRIVKNLKEASDEDIRNIVETLDVVKVVPFLQTYVMNQFTYEGLSNEDFAEACSLLRNEYNRRFDPSKYIEDSPFLVRKFTEVKSQLLRMSQSISWRAQSTYVDWDKVKNIAASIFGILLVIAVIVVVVRLEYYYREKYLKKIWKDKKED